MRSVNWPGIDYHMVNLILTHSSVEIVKEDHKLCQYSNFYAKRSKRSRITGSQSFSRYVFDLDGLLFPLSISPLAGSTRYLEIFKF